MGICSFDKNDLKEKNLHHQPNMMQSRAQDKSFQKKKKKLWWNWNKRNDVLVLLCMGK